MTKIVRVALISILCLVGITTFSFGAKGDKLPLAHLPAARYEFAPVVEGQEVSHNFVIQNKGEASLEVKRVKTD